jgi:hypothetical protein
MATNSPFRYRLYPSVGTEAWGSCTFVLKYKCITLNYVHVQDTILNMINHIIGAGAKKKGGGGRVIASPHFLGKNLRKIAMGIVWSQITFFCLAVLKLAPPTTFRFTPKLAPPSTFRSTPKTCTSHILVHSKASESHIHHYENVIFKIILPLTNTLQQH